MTTPTIPSTTRTLCVPRFGPPSTWEILDLPTPKLTQDDEVLIRVHAASLNPTDIGGAQGRYAPAFHVPLPYKIGFDLAGVVASVGSAVTRVKVGDEVFCCTAFMDRGKFGAGSVAEYAVTPEHVVRPKPKNCNFAQAASIPLVALTALQMFDKVVGGVEGKKVLVPGGLGGVGSILAQMAKTVFKAEKVITTVSTAKVAMVDKYLGERVVDEIIDYTKTSTTEAIPLHSLDVVMDSVGASRASIPLLKPSGTIITCVALPAPSGRALKNISTTVPTYVATILNIIHFLVTLYFQMHGVKYDSVLQKSNGDDLEKIRGWVEEGKIRPVVGKVVNFSDLAGIKDESGRIAAKKGGVGKVVISIISD